jgi:hypothetical protein
MSNFPGYIAIYKSSENTVKVFDLTKKTLLEKGVEYYKIPFNPLAAVGAALNELNILEHNEFLCSRAVVHVIDVTRTTIEVYDIDRLNFELELEILAG